MPHPEKSLPSPQSIATQDSPALSSSDQPALLGETKFQEAMDKRAEKIRRSIQNVLDQQIADLSAQLEQIELRWTSNVKHERQEREALSSSAKRDMEAIEAVCNDLKVMRIEHETSMKDLSAQLETSLEESEQHQVERINEIGKRVAEAVGVQERKLVDLEAAMVLNVATASATASANTTSDNLSAAIVLARVDELERALGDTIARAEYRIGSIDIQAETDTTARVNDLSKEVNTCLENAQQFERELGSGIAAFEGSMQRVELELDNVREYVDSRVGDIESQVELCSRMIEQHNADRAKSIVRLEKTMQSMCAQEVKNLATQVWHILEEEHHEHRQGLSRLHSRLKAAVLELGRRISVQEEQLSNVISTLHITGAYDDDDDDDDYDSEVLMHRGHTRHPYGKIGSGALCYPFSTSSLQSHDPSRGASHIMKSCRERFNSVHGTTSVDTHVETATTTRFLFSTTNSS